MRLVPCIPRAVHKSGEIKHSMDKKDFLAESFFQRLAKSFIGADSEKLKMRRLPPTSTVKMSDYKAKRLEP